MIVRCASLVAASILLCGPVLAGDANAPKLAGLYGTVFAGGSFANETVTTDEIGPSEEKVYPLEYNTGFIVGGAIGASIVDGIRAEVEFSYAAYSDAAIGDETVQSSTTALDLIGNIWVDFETGSGFAPYIGGGLGFGHHEASMPDEGAWLNYAASGLVYQLGAGVRVDVAEGVKLDLGYRFRGFDGSSVTFAGEKLPPTNRGWVEGENHIVQAGLNFGF